jgi:hypothetical protein
MTVGSLVTDNHLRAFVCERTEFFTWVLYEQAIPIIIKMGAWQQKKVPVAWWANRWGSEIVYSTGMWLSPAGTNFIPTYSSNVGCSHTYRPYWTPGLGSLSCEEFTSLVVCSLFSLTSFSSILLESDFKVLPAEHCTTAFVPGRPTPVRPFRCQQHFPKDRLIRATTLCWLYPLFRRPSRIKSLSYPNLYIGRVVGRS